MIEIRPATRDDVDALCDAHVGGWRDGYRGLFPDAYLDSDEFELSRRATWSRADWLSAPEHTMLAGLIDARVLGFVYTGPERVDDGAARTERGEVYSFYLKSEAWGSGLAIELMRIAESGLRDHGFAEAVLWVLRDNPRARAFYEKAGWTWTGAEMLWAGPSLADIAAPAPLAEVQYARVL